MTDRKPERKSDRNQSHRGVKSGEKIVRIFDLFSARRPTVSAGYVAERLQITSSTAYRYLALLSRAGLVEHLAGAGYALGPAITGFDWQIRLSDRLLRESLGSIRWLLENVRSGAVVLCRLSRDQVMCVHTEHDTSFSGRLSYERGCTMPLFIGAASKIILGHLPRPMARAMYANLSSRIKIRESGLGTTCEEFRDRLKEMRRTGICITRSDLDAGQVGIAGPVLDRSTRVVGSIAVLLEEQSATAKQMVRVATLVHRAAAEISAALCANA
jgi:DNA-binding IclR family transcriptional regulator